MKQKRKSQLQRYEDEMEREQIEARRPHNHAYSPERVRRVVDGKAVMVEVCYWCGGSRSLHNHAIDASSGVRKVVGA